MNFSTKGFWLHGFVTHHGVKSIPVIVVKIANNCSSENVFIYVGKWTLTGGHTNCLIFCYIKAYNEMSFTSYQQASLDSVWGNVSAAFYWNLDLILFPGEAVLCVIVGFVRYNFPPRDLRGSGRPV